jgi:hypothetical protein
VPAHRAWKERACPGPGPPLPTCPTCHQLSEFFTGSLVIHPATTQSPCRYRASTVNREKHPNRPGPRCSAVLRETRGDHDPKSGSAAFAVPSRTLAGPHACYHWRHGRSSSILVFTSCKLCLGNSICYLTCYQYRPVNSVQFALRAAQLAGRSIHPANTPAKRSRNTLPKDSQAVTLVISVTAAVTSVLWWPLSW